MAVGQCLAVFLQSQVLPDSCERDLVALQGTLFHDRMKPEVVNQIKRDLVNLEEAYLSEHAGAEIQRV